MISKRKNLLKLDIEKISKQRNRKDEVYRIGYEVLGSILLGFCNYLHESFIEDKIERVFFLSRDGKIIKKAYEMIYPDDSRTLQYLYVSRHATTIPSLFEVKDFSELVRIVSPFLHNQDVGSLLDICGIAREIVADDICIQKINMEEDINKISVERQVILFEYIMKQKSENYKQQSEYLKRYLNEEGFKGRVAVVDVGWNGTIQKSLQKYVDTSNTSIIGYYLGVRNLATQSYYYGLIRKGYFFDPNRNKKYSNMFRFTAEVIDNLFLGISGTVKCYKEEEGRIVPVLGDCEYGKSESEMVQSFQNASFDFIRDYIKVHGIPNINVRIEDIINIYKCFAVYPSLKTISIFSEFYMSDGNVMKKMIPEKRIYYYLFHADELKREFNMNVCKIWFLKWLIKIPFPYFEVLCLLSNVGVKSKLEKGLIKAN